MIDALSSELNKNTLTEKEREKNTLGALKAKQKQTNERTSERTVDNDDNNIVVKQ